MPSPLPDELVHALQHSSAAVFCHEIVMDAIDVSMAVDRHLLLYGLEGLFLLETDEASWRLPPSRAAWIPAGTYVKATTIKQVRCTSMFFEPGFSPTLAERIVAFNVTPLVREMVKHARRWDVHAEPDDAELERFSLTLLGLCHELVTENGQLSLPKAQSPELGRVLAYTRAHLAEPLRLEDAARSGAMSPRTLTRRLTTEIHMTWGQYLQAARMLQAMECLARGMQVTETAFEVGYTNMAAFSTAFRKFSDVTPSDYRSQF